MTDLSEIIAQIESLIPRFKQSSMEGYFLGSQDQARFKGMILRAKDILDENLGKGNSYSSNLIHAVNNGSGGGMIGGPSLHCVQEVVEILRAGSEKIDRAKAVEKFAAKEKLSDVAEVVNICKKFHSVARSIKLRHGGRDTILVNDEYDVQDLLRGILSVKYDDIREEDYSPAYAGGSSRIDFVLKNEKIVIETKMTRKGLADKKIGEELIVDIARYKGHPDCKIMVCFIYDPDEIIRNKNGLAADLEKMSTNELQIFVVISP